MKVASGLASGRQASAELAAQAVRRALDGAGLERADSVLLFLSRDFQRHAQAAVLAAARTAGSLQIFGSTVSGLFTERAELLDQPGAAALVIADGDGDNPAAGAPKLSFCGHGALPCEWLDGIPRVGLLDSDARAWAHGRLHDEACCEIGIRGHQVGLALSTGLRLLSAPLSVDLSEAYELRQVAGQSAAASLRRSLPAAWREAPPLHQVAIVRQPDEPGIAILSANADGSLTLAEPLLAGERICWAIRQPLAAEQDMRQSLLTAKAALSPPDFALMFSCIGRGPLFYGDEDRDRAAFREQFPGLPMLGTYGHGQIAPVAGSNRLFHNSVITLLFAGAHV